MQSEDDVREARNLADTMNERLEESGNHMESIGTGVIVEVLDWVLEQDEHGSLLKDLREDVEDTENGEIDLDY